MANKKKHPTVPVPTAAATLGSLGGKARARNLSAGEISAISRKAGRAGGRGRGKKKT